MEPEKITDIIVGDEEEDEKTILGSNSTPILNANVNNLGDSIDKDVQQSSAPALYKEAESDNVTFAVAYFSDEEKFDENLLEVIEGMKMDYDDIPLITKREIKADADEIMFANEWKDEALSLGHEKPVFSPEPSPGQLIKAPFRLKKFVTLVTDGISMKIPYAVSIPEGYKGSIRSLLDNVVRSGDYEYRLFKRNKGSIIQERKI